MAALQIMHVLQRDALMAAVEAAAREADCVELHVTTANHCADAPSGSSTRGGDTRNASNPA